MEAPGLQHVSGVAPARPAHAVFRCRATTGARGGELVGAADVERRVVPDEAGAIAGALRDFCDGGRTLVLTAGGTGFAPRDVRSRVRPFCR